MRATVRSMRRARRRGGGAALTAVYVALSTVAHLVLEPRDPGSTLWFPPAGLAFGYLLCVGGRGIPAVVR